MIAIACAAVLFDMDGVLVDSSPAIEASWRQWAERRGLPVETVLGLIHGRTAPEVIRQVAPHLSVEAEWRTLIRQEMEPEAIHVFAGAAALLRAIAPARRAVVTSAPRQIAQARLARIAAPAPGALVCAEDVAAGKPAPEGFLRAAAALGVAPADCVVVEDSAPGLAAARAAGMRAIGVATTRPFETLEADWRIRALSRLRARTTPDGVVLEIA